MKQRLMLGVIVLGAMFVLSACGSSASSSGGAASSGSGGSPADAAKGFYAGLYGDGQIDQFVCGSNKASVDAITQSVNASKSALAASNAKIDVSGLTYAVANQSGDSADVKVSGQITTTVAGTSNATDFPPVTLKMKNESGWKVCGMAQ